MAGGRRRGAIVPIMIVLGLAVAAALALALSGSGHRWGWWSHTTGFAILGAATLVAALAAVGALAVLGLALRRQHWTLALLAVAALAVAAVSLWGPLGLVLTARRVPPIHDVTTDLERPPAFVAVLARRGPGANPTDRAAPDVAAKQRAAYSDLAPLELPLPPERAMDRAVAVARALGWEIVAAVSAEGRLEATATTTWWGFRDDVVVRLTPTERGSRVDMRSVSRVGRSDLGVNAQRIRAFMEAMRQDTRTRPG